MNNHVIVCIKNKTVNIHPHNPPTVRVGFFSGENELCFSVEEFYVWNSLLLLYTVSMTDNVDMDKYKDVLVGAAEFIRGNACQG